MDVHQCARFCNNPRLVHKRFVRRITKYLAIMSTYVDLLDRNIWLTTCGIVNKTDIEKGVECDADDDFDGIWYQADANNEKNWIVIYGYDYTPTVWPLSVNKNHPIKITSLTTTHGLTLVQNIQPAMPANEYLNLNLVRSTNPNRLVINF